MNESESGRGRRWRDLVKRYDVALTVVLFACAAVAEHLELFSALENQTISFRHLLRTDVTFPDNLVLVNTDEAFFDAYESFPLRRTDIGRIARNLSRLGADVIAVDMLLDFPSSYGEDAPTARMLREAGEVLLVSQGDVANGELTGINYPVEPLNSAAATGYTNIQSTSSIVESMARLRVFAGAERFEDGWPFAVQALAMHLDVQPRLEGHTLHLGDALAVPLDRNNELFIDFPAFAAGAGTYTDSHGLTALEFLDLRGASREELAELRYWVKDKIVLIGDTSQVSHDYFTTPVGTVYGVEIIAATLATLQRGGPLQPASLVTELAVAALMMVVLLGTAFIANPGPRTLLAGGALIVWGGLTTWAYVAFGLVLSMSYVLTAGTLAFLVINLRFYLQERGQKALIHDAFGQYLSPKVVNILVKDPSRLTLGGEEREMTAFFSDIAKFSTISEQLTPEELVALLNEYLTAMCDIIADHEGTVDKFEGDAIIAFWGAPLDQAEHARRACLAAIDMQDYMARYRATLERAGRPALNVRMGLNSGRILVGNMGSRQRMDYTMMGDAVNLAARLEGANKFYGTTTTISEATYAQVAQAVEVRELDLLRVVGRREAVRIYELLARKGALTAQRRALIDHYHQALECYRARRFDEALSGFQSVLEMDPGDGPAATYVERCRLCIAEPPAAEWDGVFEATEKG